MAIVNNACNDVAATVLPNAPLDEFGFPIPTIAVATDGNATYSTSVINSDGTVYDIGDDTTGTAVSCAYDSDHNLTVVRSDGTVYVWSSPITADGQSPIATYTDFIGTPSMVVAA
ncbi:hypothetical protein N9937_01905 [bacterium]|nr:hypothetical protein [bacterium]